MALSDHSPAAPRDVLARLRELEVIAVVRSPTRDHAIRVSRLLVASGVRALEITYTTPDASDVIAVLRAEGFVDVLLGAGTIRTAEEALSAAEAGADFLVSPGGSSALIESMLATERLAVPGVFTPTEIAAAESMGVDAVKLFPAHLLGPAGLRTLRGPFPDIAFIPTGGIAVQDVGGWLEAGAAAVGLGDLARSLLASQPDSSGISTGPGWQLD